MCWSIMTIIQLCWQFLPKVTHAAECHYECYFSSVAYVVCKTSPETILYTVLNHGNKIMWSWKQALQNMLWISKWHYHATNLTTLDNMKIKLINMQIHMFTLFSPVQCLETVLHGYWYEYKTQVFICYM